MNIQENECPICGRKKIRLIGMTNGNRLLYCSFCRGNILKKNIMRDVSSSYNKKYFHDDYKKQYGRTYIEDRVSIRRYSMDRLDQIEKIFGHSLQGLRILDVGCAYGFFLEAARERGAHVEGIEIVDDAVKYAKNTLKLDVRKDDLSHFKPAGLYDCISLWYVLEHFEHPDVILSHLVASLKPGGILAFSVPNSRGYSQKCDLPSYLRERPSDHYFDFSDKGLQFLGDLFGLVPRRFCQRGIYLSRLKTKCKWLFWIPEYKIFHQLFSLICRILRRGDTMEVYLQQ